MKRRFENVDPKWKAYALAGCICVTFGVLILNLGSILSGIGSVLKVLSSLFIGFVIAYILNPLARFISEKLLRKMTKRKLAWVIAVIASFVIVWAFISFLMGLLIPQMFNSIKSLIENVGSYSENIISFAKKFGPQAEEHVKDILNFSVGENGALTQLGTLLVNNLQNILNATGSFSSKILNFLIGTILAIYFLLSKENFLKNCRKFGMLTLSPLKYARTGYLIEKFNSIFSDYIVFELLDALIVGVLNFLFMLLTGMPDAALISVIVAVTNLAPTFGPIIGAVVGGFILILVTPSKVILFLIFTVVLQSIDAYVLKPKLFGDALNVPGVIILVSIVVFGQLMGVAGLLLAIPIAAFLVYLYTETLIPWLELRRDFKAYKKELAEEERKLKEATEKVSAEKEQVVTEK